MPGCRTPEAGSTAGGGGLPRTLLGSFPGSLPGIFPGCFWGTRFREAFGEVLPRGCPTPEAATTGGGPAQQHGGGGCCCAPELIPKFWIRPAAAQNRSPGARNRPPIVRNRPSEVRNRPHGVRNRPRRKTRFYHGRVLRRPGYHNMHNETR